MNEVESNLRWTVAAALGVYLYDVGVVLGDNLLLVATKSPTEEWQRSNARVAVSAENPDMLVVFL